MNNSKKTLHNWGSYSAVNYDEAAYVQRISAERLLRFTLPHAAEAIYEPGCGTGIYSGLLLDAFPNASIMGIDICPAALTIARRKFPDPRLHLQQLNAELYSDGKYSLVTSNAVLQWYRKPLGALHHMRRMLSAGGLLTFSTYGAESYYELAEALSATSGLGDKMASHSFVDYLDWKEVMTLLYEDVEIVEETVQQHFPTLRDLLLNIRHTGTSGIVSATHCWTPARFRQLEKNYLRLFGGITASYQIYYCRGRI